MSKAKNAVVAPKVTTPPPRQRLFAIEPWRYCLLDDRQTAVIEAYVEAAGERLVIARVLQSRSIDADRTARFITEAVNAQHAHDTTVAELCSALDLCLECDGLSWEAELEAEAAVRRAREGNRAT